jgi:hypothetical protein
MSPEASMSRSKGRAFSAHCRCGRGHGASRRREEARREHVVGYWMRRLHREPPRGGAAALAGAAYAPHLPCRAGQRASLRVRGGHIAGVRRSCRPFAHADVAVERPDLPCQGSISGAGTMALRPSSFANRRPPLRLRGPAPRSQDSVAGSFFTISASSVAASAFHRSAATALPSRWMRPGSPCSSTAST